MITLHLLHGVQEAEELPENRRDVGSYFSLNFQQQFKNIGHIR